jgi:hypothetical protein
MAQGLRVAGFTVGDEFRKENQPFQLVKATDGGFGRGGGPVEAAQFRIIQPKPSQRLIFLRPFLTAAHQLNRAGFSIFA